MSHLVLFAPFIIATLILELKVGYAFRKVMLYVTICAAIGAIVANVIHFFYPGSLGLLLRERDDIAAVQQLGRVSWSGYVVTLPLIGQLGFLNVYPRMERRIVLALLPIILAGALLTFNRTLLVTIVALMVYLLVTKRKRIRLKQLTMITAACAGAFYFVVWWSAVNPNLVHLIQYRVLYFFAGTSNTTGDVSTRMLFYSEYLERLISSHFLGQGLGVPVSTYLRPTFWADVTMINFALPFGVLGVGLFAVFIKHLYKRIERGIANTSVRNMFIVVLLLALAISLNDDIWSHKNFAIYFVYLINSYNLSFAPEKQHVGRLWPGPQARISGEKLIHPAKPTAGA